MAKYAQIRFSASTMLNGIGVLLFKDILMALPSDTKIVAFVNDGLTSSDILYVESSSFIDTQTGNYPEIIVNFKHVGICPYLDSVDQSAALQAYQQPPSPPPTPICTCGSCWTCAISSAQNSIQKHIGLPAGALKPIPSIGSIQKSSGYSLAGISTGGFNQGCNHSWKLYTGLIQQYQYCEKCNEKKT